MYDKRNLIIKTIGGILLFILVYYLIISLLKNFNISVNDIKNFAQNIGPLGVIAIFLLMALSVMSPLPDSPTAIVANVLYGPLIGFAIVILGSLTGAYLDFLIFRKLGRKFLSSKFPVLNENINIIAKKYGFQSLVFLRIFPTVTFDIVSYIAAVTKIRMKVFLTATIVGLLPLALSYSIIGIGIESDDIKKLVVSLVLGFIVLIASIIVASIYGKELGINKLEGDKTSKDEENK